MYNDNKMKKSFSSNNKIYYELLRIDYDVRLFNKSFNFKEWSSDDIDYKEELLRFNDDKEYSTVDDFNTFENPTCARFLVLERYDNVKDAMSEFKKYRPGYRQPYKDNPDYYQIVFYQIHKVYRNQNMRNITPKSDITYIVGNEPKYTGPDRRDLSDMTYVDID